MTYTVTQSLHGIVTGSIYSFQVVALNDKGPSLASPILTNVMAAQLPTVPVDLLLITATKTTISFEWSDPLDDGGSPIIDFQVYWDSGVDGQTPTMILSSTLGMNLYYN